MMRFDIMTLFPDLVETVLSESVIGRAQKNGAIAVRVHNIRDYAEDKHNRVDDTPYGGGKGMLMMAPPIWRCYQGALRRQEEEGLENLRRRVIYLSPAGQVLTQKRATTTTWFCFAGITKGLTAASWTRLWTRKSPSGISS